MAKAYLVGFYCAVRDPETLAQYGRLAIPAIESAGGRCLARGGRVEAYEAGDAERSVVVEFDSFEQAVAAYTGPAYRAALDILGDAAERDVRIVEGLG